MARFVIVHGAFGGGWEWAGVARYLRDAGHDVYTPTLTGLGERSHLARPDISLETHIQDVINVLIFEDLHDVMLTGQSSSGMVITGVASRIPERIRHLIYVDALIPADGQSLFDLLPQDVVNISLENARNDGDGWRVSPPAFVHDEPVGSWANGRYGPQPIETMRQPIQVSEMTISAIPRTFIACTQWDRRDIIEPFAERARSSSDWRYRELPTIHDPQVTMPREVADLFMESAGIPR